MRSKPLVLVSALVLAAAFVDHAAGRPATVERSVDLRSGPGAKFSIIRRIPAHARVEAGASRSGWRHISLADAEGYVAAGTVSFVVEPVDAPMLPPLGAHVWRHEDPPLFDPYDSAGPWYTGPWTHAGTNVAQWRYGFPGGHVDWFRGLGWRPGFGWY